MAVTLAYILTNEDESEEALKTLEVFSQGASYQSSSVLHSHHAYIMTSLFMDSLPKSLMSKFDDSDILPSMMRLQPLLSESFYLAKFLWEHASQIQSVWGEHSPSHW